MALFELVSPNIAVTILYVALVLAMMSALVTKMLLGEEGKAARERMKKLQADLKKAQKANNMKHMQKLQKEMMEAMMENLRHSMKPMMITFIPFILVFMWLKGSYEEMGTIVALFGFNLTWFWWYLICVFSISFPLNKLLKNY